MYVRIGGMVFVFSPLTNFTIDWASSLSLASATPRDAHHRLYPALTDNLSTAYNSPLGASREISTRSEEVVEQSIYFQIQPCLSLVQLHSPSPPLQIVPISSAKSLSWGFLHRESRAGSQVVLRYLRGLGSRMCGWNPMWAVLLVL